MSLLAAQKAASRIVSRSALASTRLQRHAIPIRTLSRGMASGSESGPLKRTGLYDFHLENGARMVPFAGYSMPLSYGEIGQVTAHNHVRKSIGLFDVGHMVQSFIRGPGATPFLEHLTPSSLSSLSPFSSTLSVLLNPEGGIIDDTVICKHSPDVYYVVTNAGRRDRDLAWFDEQITKWNESGKDKVHLEVLEGWGLVALQGPKSAEYLQNLVGKEDLKALTFGKSKYMEIDGVRVHVARGGYTGEDGFEISIPPDSTTHITKLLSKQPVQLTGLGARDSLRLEAGMCLYGHDLNESITPVEAGLTWVIGKDRRTAESATFIGASKILEQLADMKSVKNRRVGFVIHDAPAREGAKVFSPPAEGEAKGKEIGVITSGIPSPSTATNIAMGYVSPPFHKKGSEVFVEVRGKLRSAKVEVMPFVKVGYWRGDVPASPKA